MFSTLLGALPGPPVGALAGEDGTSDRTVAILHELDAIGLELVTTGTDPVAAETPAMDVVAAWLRAASLTERPVKAVLAGPYSAGRDGDRTRPAALGEALATTIGALAAAGCPIIEVDEPEALAIALVPGERRRFVDAHRRLGDAAGGSDVHLSLALTGGNLDGAGAATFFDLAYASFAFDLIAGPDNWRLIAAAPQDRGDHCRCAGPSRSRRRDPGGARLGGAVRGVDRRTRPGARRARERLVAGVAAMGGRGSEAPPHSGRGADCGHRVVRRDGLPP